VVTFGRVRFFLLVSWSPAELPPAHPLAAGCALNLLCTPSPLDSAVFMKPAFFFRPRPLARPALPAISLRYSGVSPFRHGFFLGFGVCLQNGQESESRRRGACDLRNSCRRKYTFLGETTITTLSFADFAQPRTNEAHVCTAAASPISRAKPKRESKGPVEFAATSG
jgi:hypothetical protein